MYNITVWSKNNCVWCTRAKALLLDAGFTFKEINIDEYPNGKEALLDAVPGARTLPQIVIDDSPIGGFNDLQRILNK